MAISAQTSPSLGPRIRTSSERGDPGRQLLASTAQGPAAAPPDPMSTQRGARPPSDRPLPACASCAIKRKLQLWAQGPTRATPALLPHYIGAAATRAEHPPHQAKHRPGDRLLTPPTIEPTALRHLQALTDATCPDAARRRRSTREHNLSPSSASIGFATRDRSSRVPPPPTHPPDPFPPSPSRFYQTLLHLHPLSLPSPPPFPLPASRFLRRWSSARRTTLATAQHAVPFPFKTGAAMSVRALKGRLRALAACTPLAGGRGGKPLQMRPPSWGGPLRQLRRRTTARQGSRPPRGVRAVRGDGGGCPAFGDSRRPQRARRGRATVTPHGC